MITMYSCIKCGQNFEFNSLLQRHLSKKRNCDTIENINKNFDTKINEIDNEIKLKIELSIENKNTCEFCNMKLKNKGNTIRHINNTCDMKKYIDLKRSEIINQKNKLIDDKKNKDRDKNIETLQNQIAELQKNQIIPVHQTINQTINNNNIQNNIVINVNSFNNENLDHISIDNYKKYLNGFFPGFIQFIEKIHFDENAPENHNICITNLKSKYICVYENDKWITKEKNDIIDDLITKKYNLLSSKCEELEESKQISDKTIKNFEEFCENYDNIEAQKTTKNNITMMIYNNKDKLKNKPKILEKKKNK